MANIVTQEPIRYQIDSSANSASGLLVTQSGSELDCTNFTGIDGFTVSGLQPSGTQRALAFRVDGVWGKLDSSGALSPLPTQLLTADSVLEEGNTVSELTALASVPAFAGKSVGVAVALFAEDSSSVPTLGLALNVHGDVVQTTRTELSPVYDLGAESQIINITASVSASNGGTAQVEARITNTEGVVSEWASLGSFKGAQALAVQFRAILTAPRVGVSTASVSSVSVQYAQGGGSVAGAGMAEIVSVTEDWGVNVRQCRMTVRHAPLKDAILHACVAFRPNPVLVQGETVGTGDGERKTFQLAHTGGIRYDTVRLYFNGQRVYSDFEVNTEVGRVTCTAPDGAIVTADYEYGWADEVWHEMTSSGTASRMDYDSTEFRYSLPSDDTARSVCAVKIGLETTEGHVDDEALGFGTGAAKNYKLAHKAKNANLSILADGVALDTSSWLLDSEGKYVRIAAGQGASLTVSYDWVAESPIVYMFVAVFAE